MSTESFWNLLNQKKTVYPAESGAEAACRIPTAFFRGVPLIKRGGLPLRIPCLALILLLCGCASMSTAKLQPTDTIRNATTTEKLDTTFFRISQQLSADNPKLGITVVRQVRQEQSFDRRYVEKRVLKPGAGPLLILTGAALAAGGYYYFYEQGYVVLGRDLIGLGAAIPILNGAMVGSVSGEQWKPEIKTLPPTTIRAQKTPVVVGAVNYTWRDTTDARGVLTVDISSLADMAAPGQPLEVRFALQEDSTQTAAFSIPPDVVALYRAPLPAPAPEVEVAEVEHATTPLIDEKTAPTLAILDFEGLGISEQETRVLTNRLGTHLFQLGTFKVIERGQMQKILKEQDFQLTGCTSNECAVEIGQLIGAQQMLAGSFGKFATIYTIDMRIIDVATGSILRTTSYDVQGEAELLLTEGLAEAAKRIAGVD